MVSVYVITAFLDSENSKKIILKVTSDSKIALDLVEKYSSYGNLFDVKSEVCDFVG